MAGRILRDDIDAVREKVRLDEIVGEHVTLRRAGAGSMKGLCPFHDERSPSFHVRTEIGYWHCFGCGEGGDAFSFLQKMEHVSFAEAVEQLAAKVGVVLRYEEGGDRSEEIGRRKRLLDACQHAQDLFQETLLTPAAMVGRQFLAERGFDRSAAEHFGVGFAPAGWDNLRKYLHKNGVDERDALAAGLLSEGTGRGPYDRFRGRLTWPVRDITGAIIGFGARRLLEDDKGPKYLNSPDSALYHKSQVLYGLDLAKKKIATSREAVIVEGYTDVMACHLAGIDNAVATCGTAFGADHVKVLRRLIADDSTTGAVVFTFDGDEAGQKAALKAFELDGKFLAQTFVAVDDQGRDPCDLRVQGGPEAVRLLVENRRPLAEFAIRTALKQVNLDSVEGRVTGLRAAAGIVAQIKDPALLEGYAREVAGWLGVEPADVRREVKQVKIHGPQPATQPNAASSPEQQVVVEAPSATGALSFGPPDMRLPEVQLEAQVVGALLQMPGRMAQLRELAPETFSAGAFAEVLRRIQTLPSWPIGVDHAWGGTVLGLFEPPLYGLVADLMVRDLPCPAHDEGQTRYCEGIVNRLHLASMDRERADLLSRLRRIDVDDSEASSEIQRRLFSLEQARRSVLHA